MVQGRVSHLVFGFLYSVLCLQATAGDLWRIMYSDDPRLKLGIPYLEEAYGAKIHVIPPSGKAPAKPVMLDGTVLHIDLPTDADWVLGTRNPDIAYGKLRDQIAKDFPNVPDIDEKLSEANFLKTFAPKIQAPETHTIDEITKNNPVDLPTQMEIDKRVRAAMKKYTFSGKENYEKLLRLETIRTVIDKKMGKSITKVRSWSHSEGRLPKSSQDWLETYILYCKKSKPEVERLQKEMAGTSGDLADAYLKLDHIEGRVLDEMLGSPDNVVAQKMVKIHREMRMHIVEGEILKGATFLRFYDTGEYIPKEERAAVEEAVQKHFLDRIRSKEFMGGKYAKLSFTPDVVIYEGPGPIQDRISIIDFNGGLDSGYYYPEEDLFTTNLLAQKMSGKQTPLLRKFEQFDKSPIGPEKLKKLQDFLARYKPFVTEETVQATWDRIIDSYAEAYDKAPSAENLDLILKHFQKVKLEDPTVYLQLLNQTSDAHPNVRLSPERTIVWERYLNGLDAEEIQFKTVNGKFSVVDEEKEKSLAIAARPPECNLAKLAF